MENMGSFRSFYLKSNTFGLRTSELSVPNRRNYFYNHRRIIFMRKLPLKSKFLFAAYVAAILLLVVLPLNTSASLNTITIVSFRGDYFLHAVSFFPWAFFGRVLRRNMPLWFFYGLLFAAGSEGLQHLIAYRAFNINDLIGNAAGIVLGFMALWIMLFFFPQRADRPMTK